MSMLQGLPWGHWIPLLGPLAKPYVCKAIVKLCVLNEFCLNCKFSKSIWQIIYCK